MSMGNCPLCSAESENYPNSNTVSVLVKCRNCGRFIYFGNDFDGIDKDKLATFLFYNKGYSLSGKEKCFVIDRTKTYDITDSEAITFSYLTDEIVNNWYPKTFTKKLDNILLYLAEHSLFYGDEIKIKLRQLASLCFFNGINGEESLLIEQLNFLVKIFNENELIEIVFPPVMEDDEYSLKVTPSGWKRVDELQKDDKNNKNVFVSMAFNKKTKATRESIRNGIINAGYSPEFIDEIIHNNQIVPEMFRLIRECKFLILDISDPNYGAYYEAGYALGLGKEVIICCNEDVFNGNFKANGNDITKEEIEKFGRYLKPHFDIAQKQILVWKDHADLTKKLSEWIKALF